MSSFRPGPKNLITDVAGLKVGHASDEAVRTGVTALLCETGWAAASFWRLAKRELGRSEGAVKQLQLRAIENLRAQMEGAHA